MRTMYDSDVYQDDDALSWEDEILADHKLLDEAELDDLEDALMDAPEADMTSEDETEEGW